ncbi:MAG TPA: nuclear transport factor 2 family protein [Gemmatimonadaceae bacterium]|nr:nuclear transport factor 2 family protein [Gemmatimonadaceae bacterium]
MTRTTRISALVALTVLTSITIVRPTDAQSKDEQAIREAGQAWQRYTARQQIDSIVGMHTSDAILMLANSPVIKGSAGIRSGWAEMAKTPGLDLHWTPQRIEVTSPTTATEYGTYTESYDTPNGKASDAGSYVTLWRKVRGKWQVALDAPVSTMPAPAAAPTEASTFTARNGSALAWSDFAPPGFPPGGKISVLHGDPSAAGRFVLRLSFPDGYQVPLHWHPTAEYVTVVSGGGQFGMGNTVDMSATQSFAPGDFVFIPARHAHYLQMRGPTILQVSGNGPFQLNLGVPK